MQDTDTITIPDSTYIGQTIARGVNDWPADTPILREALIRAAFKGSPKAEVRAWLAKKGIETPASATVDRLIAAAERRKFVLIPLTDYEKQVQRDREAENAGRSIWLNIQDADEKQACTREAAAARLIERGADAHSLEALAQTEAEVMCWRGIEAVLLRNGVPGGLTIFEAVLIQRRKVEQALIRGADDNWSGVGITNGLCRASQNGLRDWYESYPVAAAVHYAGRTLDELTTLAEAAR